MNKILSRTAMAAAKATSSPPHVVIVGGAYAGLSALNSLVSLSNGKGLPVGKHGAPPASSNEAPPGALRNKPRYTLLDERDGFYHTVGAPLGQISVPHAREFWVKYDEILAAKKGEDVQFVHGSAVGLDIASKTLTFSRTQSPAHTEKLSYDYLIVASGMSRKWPVVPTSLDFETYMRDVQELEDELSQYNKIVVVGGGACGIEMSAELKVHFPSKEIILIHSRSNLLTNEPIPEDFKSKALELLREEGVDVRLNTRVQKDSPGSVVLSTGETLPCDKVIYTAVQQHANAKFVPEALREDKWGCVKVRDTFQFDSEITNADAHYAVGDAAHWPSTIKRSGPAQMQGKIAASNIIASLVAVEEGRKGSEAKLEHCAPSTPTMTLAVGTQAVAMRGGLIFGKEVKNRAFGTGLGIDGTLANLGLRPRRVEEVKHATGVLEDPKAITANM